MKFDFSSYPFFDDHTHLLNVTNREINLKEFIGPFNHGYVDTYPDTVPFHVNVAGNNRPQDISEGMLEKVVKHLGVSKCFVNYLSEYYNCECSYEAILAERNKRSLLDMKAYTAELYQDQNIIAEVVDAAHPMGDPAMNCFPVPVYRLFQTDGVVAKAVQECESYNEALDRFDATLRKALKDGFVGVKCHILELTQNPPHHVSKEDGEKYFRDAKNGDKFANEEVYLAMFCHMMLMTQELDFPVHLHTGLTGKMTYVNMDQINPLRFVKLLSDKRYVNSHLMFLHVGYPHVRSASVMAQSFPNVWIDLAQVLPWEVFNITNILEDTMGFASHSKITIGTGAHIHPEINWMSAKIAKKALEVVLENAVHRNFMNAKQADETAKMILYKNAQRLYRLD